MHCHNVFTNSRHFISIKICHACDNLMLKLNDLSFAELYWTNDTISCEILAQWHENRRKKPIVKIDQICEMKWLHFYYSLNVIRQLNLLEQWWLALKWTRITKNRTDFSPKKNRLDVHISKISWINFRLKQKKRQKIPFPKKINQMNVTVMYVLKALLLHWKTFFDTVKHFS